MSPLRQIIGFDVVVLVLFALANWILLHRPRR